MKFSTTLPLLALLAQQTLAVALPRDEDGTLAVRQNRGGAGKGRAANGKFGQGAAKGGAGGKAAATTAAAAATTAAAAAAATASAATGKAGAATSAAAAATGGDPQTSLALDPSQVQSNAKLTGQAGTPEAGQVNSLTSANNFINFCLTQNGVPITNGLQTKTGSCNPTIMGRILATDKLVSSKFVFPVNNQDVAANQDFTIQMSIKNMVTGNFVNPNTNYYAAPCQVDGSGTVIGHSHVVIEKVASITSTTVLDPTLFVFFKGLNAAAANGVLSADVAGGLPAGSYRLASINTCANHQPVLGSVAQHGSFDDMVYFTVGAGTGNAAAGAGAAAAGTGAAAAAAAAGNGGKGAAAAATTAQAAAATTAKAAAATTAATGGKGAAAAAAGNKAGGFGGKKGGKRMVKVTA